MNYTKGKWEQSGSIILVYGEEGGIICQMAEYRPKSGLVEFHPIEISDPHWGTQIANATLIAAASDMYEACKSAYETLPTTVTPQEFLTGHGNWGLDEKEYAAALILAKALAKAEGGVIQ